MIPKNIGRKEIISAIKSINVNRIPLNRNSKKYYLEFENEYFPPKYIIAIANKFCNREELNPEKFSGGKEVNQFLIDLGFKIVSKDKLKNEIKYSKNTTNHKTLKNENLKIGLVSFILDDDFENLSNERLNIVLDVINQNNQFDILVFSGWTIASISDLKWLEKKITNDKSLIFLEVHHVKDNNHIDRHKGYAFQNGKLIDRNIIQIFATSQEVEYSPYLIKYFINEQFQDKRKFIVKNKIIRWIICGEINFLKNQQSDDNKVFIRVDDEKLKLSIKNIIKETDVFINPTHTQMGNQGKMHKRREYLSNYNKIFCSASNLNVTNRNFCEAEYKVKLQGQVLQYLYYNSENIFGKIILNNSMCIVREFDV